jgi:phage gpG-like protein
MPPILRLKQELENPKALMKQLGAMTLGASIDSFKNQRLGPDIKWAARYPNQGPPKLNLAGFVSDFANGRLSPKPIRFVDRPVLIDEGFRGGLVGSMTYRAIDNTSFEVGTNKPYASKHQFGGIVHQKVTKPMKDAMKRWLYKGGDREKGVKKKAGPYEDKVRKLLRKHFLTTQIGKRPFVGMFQQLWDDILMTIEEYFQKHAGGKA